MLLWGCGWTWAVQKAAGRNPDRMWGHSRPILVKPNPWTLMIWPNWASCPRSSALPLRLRGSLRDFGALQRPGA